MCLETSRLIIRSFDPADAPGRLALFGEPEVRTYPPPFPDPTLEKGLKKYVADRATWRAPA